GQLARGLFCERRVLFLDAFGPARGFSLVVGLFLPILAYLLVFNKPMAYESGGGTALARIAVRVSSLTHGHSFLHGYFAGSDIVIGGTGSIRFLGRSGVRRAQRIGEIVGYRPPDFLILANYPHDQEKGHHGRHEVGIGDFPCSASPLASHDASSFRQPLRGSESFPFRLGGTPYRQPSGCGSALRGGFPPRSWRRHQK